MTGKEMTKDWNWIKHKLSRSGVSNSVVYPITHNDFTNNATVYQLAGKILFDTDLITSWNINDVIFSAESGAVGASGMNVQLYDATNAVEIGVIFFDDPDDFTIKNLSVKTYFLTLTGAIIIEVNFAKGANPGANANLGASTLSIIGS